MRNDPEALELAPEPSPKEIDPDRRWAVGREGARLLGWEAKVGPREGVAETAEWLRATEVAV